MTDDAFLNEVDDDPNWVTVLCERDGTVERVGTIEAAVIPAAGDVLVLGYPGDSHTGPYEVKRREYVNGAWYTITVPTTLAASSGATYLRSF